MLFTLATLILLITIATLLYLVNQKLSEHNDIMMVFTSVFVDANTLRKKMDALRKKKDGTEKPVRKPRNNSGSELYQ